MDAVPYTGLNLSVEERKARLARLVDEGVATPEQAAMIDFREPPPALLERVARLAAESKSR